MYNRQTNTVISLAGLIAATAMMLAGSFGAGDVTYRLGLALSLCSAVCLVVARCCVTESLLERVRQDGYDQGYEDGCEVTRPLNVVALVSAGRGVTDGSAAHQLGKQGDVRRGTDRVV